MHVAALSLGGSRRLRDERASAVGAVMVVFLLALAVRVAAVAVLWVAAPDSMTNLLGPDSRGYLRVAQALAARGFHLPSHPTIALGTYDAGPYYLFGVVVWLGGGLFTLQLLNSALGALAAAFTFAAAQRVLPKFAFFAGVLVALNPSLIALSSIGLLKDPSIMCASTAVMYGVAVLVGAGGRDSHRGEVAAWLLVIAALSYLRVARFYTAAYLELGLLAVAFSATYHQVRSTRVRIGVGALGVVAAAELVPVALGWPSSARLVIDQVRYVLGQPLMMHGSRGMVDSLFAGGGVEAATTSHGAFRLIDMVRRAFGPFVWVVPPDWNRLTLIYSNDFVLYPGTLIWYALQPYLMAGVWSSRRLVRACRVDRLWLLILAIFSVVYLMQFALVNLSYRQRDAMFPLFLIIALAGYEESRTWKNWPTLLALYWSLLALLAIAHMLVGAMLRG